MEGSLRCVTKLGRLPNGRDAGPLPLLFREPDEQGRVETRRVDVSDILYADDHVMLRPVMRLADLKQELDWAEQAQAHWGLAMGEGKCELVVRWVGQGSRKLRRRMGSGVISSSGFKVPVHWEAKYLGCLLYNSDAADDLTGVIVGGVIRT